MGGPAGSYASAGTALDFIEALKPSRPALKVPSIRRRPLTHLRINFRLTVHVESEGTAEKSKSLGRIIKKHAVTTPVEKTIVII